jgi:hypothetical protein
MPSASSSSSSNGGVSFSKKNADINYDVKIVGPKVPWEHKGSKAPSSSSTSSTKGRGMAANGKGASNSDSEVGTRRGKATKEEMANGNAAMSPAQQLLMRMYQKKAAAAGTLPPPNLLSSFKSRYVFDFDHLHLHLFFPPSPSPAPLHRPLHLYTNVSF